MDKPVDLETRKPTQVSKAVNTPQLTNFFFYVFFSIQSQTFREKSAGHRCSRRGHEAKFSEMLPTLSLIFITNYPGVGEFGV